MSQNYDTQETIYLCVKKQTLFLFKSYDQMTYDRDSGSYDLFIYMAAYILQYILQASLCLFALYQDKQHDVVRENIHFYLSFQNHNSYHNFLFYKIINHFIFIFGRPLVSRDMTRHSRQKIIDTFHKQHLESAKLVEFTLLVSVLPLKVLGY